MITIVYSTHKDEKYNEDFEIHLKKTSGLSNVQIIRYPNHNEFSLAYLYNKGIEESKFDIVVCLHNDIILSKGWGKNILSDFNKNPDYGIIGKAGSCYFPESGIYWERMGQTMVGQVYHRPPNSKKFLSQYSFKSKELIPVVTIDGLFISFNKQKIKHRFDESIGKFHFYDHSFCLPNFLDGVKIGVTSSLDITHESVGRPSQEFFESKNRFLEKFKSSLPIDIKPDKIILGNVEPKNSKNNDKVALIILTKSKIDLLFNCINSFIENCNENYEIFIADTGSSEDEKKIIVNYIKNVNKVPIHFIEYNFYNFAKINNDVVINHINETFTHLLFVNNDIKILTNVIDSMLSIFSKNNRIGTVGGMLYYEDNTVQHNGIGIYVSRSKNKMDISHVDLRSYYPKDNKTRRVIGNTGALLMIRKNVFEKVGKFNEEYINCFEDVELNLTCIKYKYENYLDSHSIAYHYESQTRQSDPDNLKKLQEDYSQRLYPYIIKNFDNISNHIIYTN